VRQLGFLLLTLAAVLAFPIKGNAGIEVPCEFSAGLIKVHVSARGTSEPLQFLLDSGASQSVIDAACARRLGLKTETGRLVVGVNWQHLASEVSDFDGQLAGISLPRSMLAFDLKGVAATAGRRVDGIIGLDFFRQHVVQIDYADRRVRFFRRGEVNADGDRFSLVTRNGALCVRAMVNSTPRLLRLDTGCNSAIECVELNSKRQERGTPSVAVQSGTGLQVTRAQLALGSLHLADIESGWHSTRFFPGEDGLLGNGILSRFRITVDAVGRRLYLAKR
jgi:hypothetical protein